MKHLNLGVTRAEYSSKMPQRLQASCCKLHVSQNFNYISKCNFTSLDMI